MNIPQTPIGTVESLLITGKDEEQLSYVHLAIALIAHDVNRRGNTVHYKVQDTDVFKCIEACKKYNATVQTIRDVPCQIYPLLFQGDAKAQPPLTRWLFHWSKVIPGMPLFAWINDDRSATYKGPPFDGKPFTYQPSEDYTWLEIGDLASFTDIDLVVWVGPEGRLETFKTEAEAKAFAEANNVDTKQADC